MKRRIEGLEPPQPGDTTEVDLIRKLSELLCRAQLEILSPGSSPRMPGNLMQQIEAVQADVDEYLDIEDGEQDEASVRALAKLLDINVDS